MTHEQGVSGMFGRIAPRYVLLNRLMSFGMDASWRRQVVRWAGLRPGCLVLDVGTGTGDIALEALRFEPSIKVIGADFTAEMMREGRKRPGGGRILWCRAHALTLPFPEAVFDAVTSGFLVRNVSDPLKTFQEQVRVVKPGGWVVCLDTSPPPRNLLRPLVVFHLKAVIPALGTLVARDRAAYRYLPASTQAFLPPERLARIMSDAGLEEVSFRSFMLGTIAVLRGRRPPSLEVSH
ncbi:MAG: ubiquinone/menaquinone biosynthesis methyltransferase [Deltaproteobacteria bacterium]|nr:ubiquinone/menaquinone biosynthesis methyltransferase [Deltaproteobacteria bacterium]